MANQQQDATARRAMQLLACDPQCAAAQPLPDVMNAIRQPGMRLAQMLETMMRGYSTRPALGRRARAVRPGSRAGEDAESFEPHFTTLTYGQVWADVEAVAAVWSAGEDAVRPGDLVATLGFSSPDYVVVDMVCGYLGLVAVPLQHNSVISRLQPILEETRPAVLAVSADKLELGLQCARQAPSVRRLMVFDVDEATVEHHQIVERVRAQLADRAVVVESVRSVVACGRDMPAPALYDGGDDQRLALILYTSGSTGQPKGAMWTERMVTALWTTDNIIRSSGWPIVNLNFMPLNHVVARTTVATALQSGGTSYFVSRGDLSTLFEDWALVRPTQMTLVPRIVDMLFQQYQTRVQRLRGDGADAGVADEVAKAELRQDLLGGRVVAGYITGAPISHEMRTFIETCLQTPVPDNYGMTEMGDVTHAELVVRPPVIDYKLIDVPELGYYTTDRPHPRGELLVLSETATPGYYKRPDVTAEVFTSEGYYRTGDIMAEVEPDHLVFVDRRNNVLKLAQGEFVAIATLEAIYAAAPPVEQIFIYGNSERSALLAVVVPTKDCQSRYGDPGLLKSAIRDSLLTAAQSAGLQNYEVPEDILIETASFSADNGLLTGVGKLSRPTLNEHYASQLELLYDALNAARADSLRALHTASGDQPTIATVIAAARTVLGLAGDRIDADTHFIDLGGDSLSAVSFSSLLGEIFHIEVPVGVIISASSDLAATARFIDNERSAASHRPTAAKLHGANATTIAASDLSLDAFIDEDALAAAASLPSASDHAQTVLLTGANGYLGRFLALEWLRRLAPTGGRLITLMRGDDATSARRRLEQAFDSGDAGLLKEFRELTDTHLDVLVGDLGEPNLALDETTWQKLASDVDLIVHPAALVNHLLPYGQLFGPNVVGTAEVIRLAISNRLKPVTYLSTVLVASGVAGFDEEGDIRTLSPQRRIDIGYANGYATSKWAGEVLLREAHDRCGLPVSVFRADMIMGHRHFAGQLNVADAFTRLLLSLMMTGIAPASFYSDDGSEQQQRAHYDGLPADFVAAAVTGIGATNNRHFKSFNVMNPHDDGISLDIIVDWLIDSGVSITRINDYADWVSRFEVALRALPEQRRQRSVLALMDAYRRPATPVRGVTESTTAFQNALHTTASGAERHIPHVDRALIAKYVADLTRLQLV